MNTVKTFLTAGLTALVLTAAPAAYSAPESPISAAQIEAAKTPAEHEAIAKIFEDEAASLTKKSEMHGEMAKNYSKMGVARHCAALEKDYKAAAKQNLALAAIHHKLAQEAAK
jgi:hypothetical protein